MHIITHRYCVLFSWRGALSLWFACRLQSTIINRLSLSVSLDLSRSLSLSLSLSLFSLSLSLSLSLLLSPSLLLTHSEALSLSLSLSPLSPSHSLLHIFSVASGPSDTVSWVVGKVHQIALLSSPPLFLTLCLTLWVSSLGIGKSRPIFQGLALRKPAFSVQNLHFTDLLDPLADCTTKEASGWSLRLKVPQNSRGAGRIFHAFE